MADQIIPITKPQRGPLVTFSKDGKDNPVTTLKQSDSNIGIHKFKADDETVVVDGQNNEGVIDLGPGNNTAVLRGPQDNLRIIGNPKEDATDTAVFPKGKDAYEIIPTGNFDVSPPAIDHVTVKEKDSKAAGTVLQGFEQFRFKDGLYDLPGALKKDGKPIEKAPIIYDSPPEEPKTIIR